MELLTINDVAARLKISKSLVYALVESGKLIPYRIGLGRGAIRIAEADLLSYLDSCRVEKEPPRKAAPRPRLKHIRLN